MFQPRFLTAGLAVLASMTLLPGTAPALAEDGESLPTDEGFQQLIPRGKIAALVDPEFVPAAEAEIPDDAWVLGFASGGEAYAYDLNILNSHEVVNHRVAGSAYAAVW